MFIARGNPPGTCTRPRSLGRVAVENKKAPGARSPRACSRYASRLLDHERHPLHHLIDCRNGAHELGATAGRKYDGALLLAVLFSSSNQPRGSRRPTRMACGAGGHPVRSVSVPRTDTGLAAPVELRGVEYSDFHLDVRLWTGGLSDCWRLHGDEYLDDGACWRYGPERPRTRLIPSHRECFLRHLNRHRHCRRFSTLALAAFAAAGNARPLSGNATHPARGSRVRHAVAGRCRAPESVARRNQVAPRESRPPCLQRS